MASRLPMIKWTQRKWMLNRQTANNNRTKGDYLSWWWFISLSTLQGLCTLLTCVRPINLLMFSDKKIMSPSDVTTLMKPPSDFRYQLSISLSTSVVSVAVAQAAMGHKTREFENACVHVSVRTLASLVLALKSLADVQNKQQQLHPATPNPPNNTEGPSQLRGQYLWKYWKNLFWKNT